MTTEPYTSMIVYFAMLGLIALLGMFCALWLRFMPKSVTQSTEIDLPTVLAWLFFMGLIGLGIYGEWRLWLYLDAM